MEFGGARILKALCGMKFPAQCGVSDVSRIKFLVDNFCVFRLTFFCKNIKMLFTSSVQCLLL